MTSLSTHVLDTSRGGPAAGVAVQLFDASGALLWEGATDADGRCPALREQVLEAGRYRLVFAVAAYFRAAGATLPEPPFLDAIPLDFGITGTGHYHVPLLVSPFGYSTYRGS
ncbi:5-hydroxyisourate hydrolase [Pseudoxanthomonas sp. GM95]|uniref:hydroxyisourate hydrolase n=1 Tax=Pseudoxanthomonas sp. GM95 TaxID=1881043 RepID=UPI0008B8C80A|nr:hydroxyisourate hydrolase [Pseudoxanthomonas sp. GM95]SEK96874.1 5-hydroxyisourate hydrolase [Pseudoxanthomonas sp. GM95]